MKAKGAAPVKAAVAPPTTTTVVTTTPNPPTSSAAPNPFMQMVGPFFGADGGVTQGTPAPVPYRVCVGQTRLLLANAHLPVPLYAT
jgi:hypothetical protein